MNYPKLKRVTKPCLLVALSLAVLLCFVKNSTAGEVTAAVSANFLAPFKAIAKRFEETSKHKVHIVSGSTGKLFAQILHGAPFDIFLSADRERPRILQEKGLLVAGSRFTYAIGRLTLWSSDPDRLSQNGPLVLRQGKFRHLALTNPKTAPYGRAALQVLKNLNLWDSLEGSVVQGESVSQTFHFIATGNAELGFVALSQAIDPNLKIKGSRWDVPDHLHDPIDQDAGLIKKNKPNPAAKQLIQFIQGQEAIKIIVRYGYKQP